MNPMSVHHSVGGCTDGWTYLGFMLPDPPTTLWTLGSATECPEHSGDIDRSSYMWGESLANSDCSSTRRLRSILGVATILLSIIVPNSQFSCYSARLCLGGRCQTGAMRQLHTLSDDEPGSQTSVALTALTVTDSPKPFCGLSFSGFTNPYRSAPSLLPRTSWRPRSRRLPRLARPLLLSVDLVEPPPLACLARLRLGRLQPALLL